MDCRVKPGNDEKDGPVSPSAYFPASLRQRFPHNILSLIRSFARHPALLSRETKMTVQPGGF
jgi:hypothetical protein